jgi:hypothetical protein
MTIETLAFYSLTAFLILICMVGYLIHLQGEKKPKSVSAGTVGVAPRGYPGGTSTIHPGMSDEHFMAIAGAVASHYRISDQELIAILTAAAAHTLGMSVSVVKFKPLNTMDWTWAVQGRVALHSHKV